MIATVVTLAFLCYFFLFSFQMVFESDFTKARCANLNNRLHWTIYFPHWAISAPLNIEMTGAFGNLETCQSTVQGGINCLVKKKKKARWRHFILVRGALTHPTHLGCAHCASKTLQWPCCDMKRPVWGVNNEIAFHAAAALRPTSL